MDKIKMIIIFNILSILCFLPCGIVADPDPLQDMCVANLSSSLRVNGLPCKAGKTTASSDFFSSKLRKGGNTDNPNGSNATVMDAMAFPGLNTQGANMVSIYQKRKEIPLMDHLCFLPCDIVADPDPLQDMCVANLSTSDFLSPKLGKGENTDNPNGSNATVMDAMAFPGLNTQGISTNRVDFAVGGINPPHVHPRASELGRVEKGTLYLGILDTQNNFYSKTLKAGDSFVIPRGLLHFQYNVGEEEATQIVSFNSQDPGIIFVLQSLFGSTPEIPTKILAKAFRTDTATIEYLRSGFVDDADSSKRTTS